MFGWKAYLTGAGIFLGAFLLRTGWELARERVWVYFETYYTCPRYNLKEVWVLSQKVSKRYRVPFPPTLELVKQATKKTVFLTEREAQYLGMPYLAGSYFEFPLALLCPRDPKYLLKIAMDLQGLDYEPSYRWCPDGRTLAECPYCHIAVLLDGRIEKRQR